MTRRMQIVSGPQPFWMSVSAFHVWIEIEQTTEESIGAGLLDLSPDAQDAHTQYVWGRGSRSTGDTLDADGDRTTDFFMIDNGTPDSQRRVLAKGADAVGTSVPLTSGGGSSVYFPADVRANFSVVERIAGRPYNILFGSTAGASITIPVGTASETKTFRASAQLPEGNFIPAIRRS